MLSVRSRGRPRVACSTPASPTAVCSRISSWGMREKRNEGCGQNGVWFSVLSQLTILGAAAKALNAGPHPTPTPTHQPRPRTPQPHIATQSSWRDLSCKLLLAAHLLAAPPRARIPGTPASACSAQPQPAPRRPSRRRSAAAPACARVGSPAARGRTRVRGGRSNLPVCFRTPEMDNQMAKNRPTRPETIAWQRFFGQLSAS